MSVRAVVVVVLLALSSAACGDDKEAAGCAKAFAEPIDPNSSVHILPGQPELPYKTNPPTSGAHRVTQIPSAPARTPLAKPDQVHILEAGRVLIQYRGLSSAQRGELERLAGTRVVVAPNDSLDTAVVATAWLYKMECTKVDVPALQDFVKAHAEKVSLH